jgi:hypothetical protein
VKLLEEFAEAETARIIKEAEQAKEDKRIVEEAIEKRRLEELKIEEMMRENTKIVESEGKIISEGIIVDPAEASKGTDSVAKEESLTPEQKLRAANRDARNAVMEGKRSLETEALVAQPGKKILKIEQFPSLDAAKKAANAEGGREIGSILISPNNPKNSDGSGKAADGSGNEKVSHTVTVLRRPSSSSSSSASSSSSPSSGKPRKSTKMIVLDKSLSGDNALDNSPFSHEHRSFFYIEDFSHLRGVVRKGLRRGEVVRLLK